MRSWRSFDEQRAYDVNAADRWREALEAWAIPEPILLQAPESPYGFPTELFRRRAERSASVAPTATTIRANEALSDGGTVLDVGVGGGSTSLPLGGRASLIVGVDAAAAMLAAFRETAAATGVRVETVEGAWPASAGHSPVCDVVVCGHVLYNVPHVAPFVRALDDHARARVVLELTGEHPWSWMNDLWIRFYDLERPTSPTAEDARDVLRELGVSPGWDERVAEPQPSGFERREDAVALVRRRLCLRAEADEAIAGALGDRLRRVQGLWSVGPATTRIVTMWWNSAARSADAVRDYRGRPAT
jgi:Methyltransferase domain